jgi:hypothetical protein
MAMNCQTDAEISTAPSDLNLQPCSGKPSTDIFERFEFMRSAQ